MLRLENLYQFLASCAQLELDPPAIVTRALELIETAQQLRSAPEQKLLELDPADVEAWVLDTSLRSHSGGSNWNGSTQGVDPGVDKFTDGILAELRVAIVPGLDQIVAGLQQRFAAAAAPLETAARDFRFTYDTTAGK